jgi:hypothetical protein
MKQADAFLNRRHPHNDKDDFRTPRYLFDYMEFVYGEIEYDGACTPGVNNLATPLRLEDEWPASSTIYSNPPYDKDSIIKWFEKGEEVKASGGLHIMLLPNKLSQKFMSPMIMHFSEIIFLGGRVNFISPYAVKGGSSMNGSIITTQYLHDRHTHAGVHLSLIKEKFAIRGVE